MWLLVKVETDEEAKTSVCVCVSKDKDETTEGSGDRRDQGSPSQRLERWLSLGLTTAACVCARVWA